MQRDMEMFARHAKRSTVQIDDVKLVRLTSRCIYKSQTFLISGSFLSCQCARRCPDVVVALEEFVAANVTTSKKRKAATCQKKSDCHDGTNDTADDIDSYIGLQTVPDKESDQLAEPY